MTTEKGSAINFGNQDITVTFKKKQCIGMSECGRADGELFVGDRDPWCDPSDVSLSEVQEVIERCPSGALTCIVNGENQEQAAAENTVQISYNGPLLVKGELDLQCHVDTAPGNKFRAALCRCGDSKNKPFCDNSHIAARFRDSGAVGRKSALEIKVGGHCRSRHRRMHHFLLKETSR